MAILSKTCKPDNFELHNSLKLSFTNIWGLHSNFVDCESFLESNSPDIVALCETNLDDSINSGNLSVRGYLPLIWKDSSTHMHSASLCEGRTCFCMGLISRKLCCFLLIFLTGFTSLSVLLLFLYWSPSLSFCTVFDSVLIPSAVFVFGGFNVHYKDWHIYSGGADWPGDLTQLTLLRWLTFLLGSQAVILVVLLFWIYIFLLMLLFVLQWLSLHWEILITLLAHFWSTIHQIHNRMPCFIALLMTILVLIGTDFMIIWEMFHGRISLNLMLLLLLVNFVSGFRLELMYISLIENIRSSLIHLHSFQLLVLLP